VVSQIGDAKAKLVTAWSGLYSLSKIVHVLLVVFDEAKQTHHLRVIRMTTRRVEDKDTSVLEHVCVHLLVPPEKRHVEAKDAKSKKKGSAKGAVEGQDRVVGATFDAAGLVLSCLWSSGVFAAYSFGRTKQLASLDVNVPPRESSSLLYLPVEAVKSTRFVAYRENHVCFATGGTVVLYNTLFGTTVSEPVVVPTEKDDPVVCFVAASNDSFLLLATRSKLMRVNLTEPESFSLVHCLDTAAQTQRIFGHQPRFAASTGVDYTFSVTDGRAVVSPDAAVSIPASGEKLSELLASRCTLGVGYALRGGNTRLRDLPKEAVDTYSLSPDFGGVAVLEFARRKDWQSVQRIVEARLFAFPPEGLVELAIAERQTWLCMTLVEMCPALSRRDLGSILSFALGARYEQPGSKEQGFANVLLEAVVSHQKCTHLLDLEPSELQSLFSCLTALFQSSGVMTGGVDVSSLVDWLCCVIDSGPLSFSLDPKMAELVVELSGRVKKEIELVKTLSDVEVALDVVKNHQVPAVSQQSSLYSIEYLSFAD
jgi:hypothetical protein